LLAGVIPEVAEGAIAGNLVLAGLLCGHDPSTREVVHDEGLGMARRTTGETPFLDWFATHGDSYLDSMEWAGFAIAAAHQCWTRGAAEHAELLRLQFAPLSGRHLVVPFTQLYGGAVDHHVAAFDTLTGRLDEAIERVTTVIASYERLDAPLFTALGLEVLAAALQRRRHPGDGSAQAEALARAGDLAVAIGHRKLRARLEALARSDGRR
jgi:hypothetical protein